MYWTNMMPYPPASSYHDHSRFPHYTTLQIVQNCEATCEYTGNELLKRDDVSARREQLKMLSDCASLCALTAKYIASESTFAKWLATFCAQVCEFCGNHCLTYDDPLSKACGQICLNCAKECQAFAAGRL